MTEDLSTKKEDAEYELLYLKEKYEELLEESIVLRLANQDYRKENEQLKQQLNEYEKPNCKKCIEYSSDGAGDYCMSENGLLGSAWEMFPFGWDYTNAKDCKEYEE